MGSAHNRRTGSPRRRIKATRIIQPEPLTSPDGAVALTGADVSVPADEVTHERESIPVASPVFDSPTIGERLAFRSRQVWDYIRQITLMQWLWIGVLLLATILRFWDLGAKPLHHDESMHAYFSLAFARNPSGYMYDPLLHGPFQFHAEGLVFMIILAAQKLFGVGGATGSPWINDTTARILPALFGVGIVALPLGLQRKLGRVGALVAALLLAVSPAFVYFSRFLREDIYFNFFMFAMVVCAVQYAHKRSIRWIVGLALAAVFAYATFEGIYLTLIIFLSFLVILVLWELAYSLARKLPKELTRSERRFFSRAGIFLLAGAVGAVLAYIGLQVMHNLNKYITSNSTKADAQVLQLENTTVLILLYLSIIVAIVVISVLLWQVSRDDAQVRYATDGGGDVDEDEGDDVFPPQRSFARRLETVVTAPGRRIAAIRERIDPREKPFVHMLLGISWVHWFVAIVAGWMLFAALYWVLPPGPQGNLTWGQGFQVGIGRGVWQGLYYWLQQQEIARGGQPVYYYALLLPLYEQLAIVFGLAGAVYSFFRPTRFRMFLVWWFVVSFGLYSWAGEKMPWLSIHILLPLMLLAGIMIARVIAAIVNLSWDVREQGIRALLLRPAGRPHLAAEVAEEGADEAPDIEADEPARSVVAESASRHVAQQGRRVAVALRRGYRAVSWRAVGTIAAATLAVALFIPMVHSMVELSYINPADGPLEMMVYVQTTPDVTAVMAKINAADQKLNGGRHQLQIWVGQGEEWPMYWYLRDYYLDPHPGSYAVFDPDVSAPFVTGAPVPDVLILLPSDAEAFMAAHPGYHAHEYKLRSWWDESYKLPLCSATVKSMCTTSGDWGTGVGPGPYLSYGSNPPPNAKFDLGRATNRLWNWLWNRQPLGAVNGSYDFTFVVRDGLPIQP